MEINEKIEWIKPERIGKLCDKYKSGFSDNRLFIIGIGREGVETVVKCKSITEKRFVGNNDCVDFLAIGEHDFVEGLNDNGTTLERSEMFLMSYEECLYNFLNMPARISPYAIKWFDLKLKNTSPMTPTYALHKRQCGRLVLFNCIKAIIHAVGDRLNTFSAKAKPVEIILTGNLGDAFFGGMFIDLAYILQKMFSLCKFPVEIKAYMYMSDVTELYETDLRELDFNYTNQLAALSELNRLQTSAEPFVQKYADTFEVNSSKFPFSSCFLISAKCEDRTEIKSYSDIIEAAAEKILLRAATVFPNNKDDGAERVVTYNLMKIAGLAPYNYLAFSSKIIEIPLGDMVSYLSLKSFKLLQNKLQMQNPSDELLNKIVSVIPENWKEIAYKGGEVPELNFNDERVAGFQPKNIKMNNRAVRETTEKWVSDMSEIVNKQAAAMADDIVKSIIKHCDDALSDIKKGTYYAGEIMKKCLTQLRLNIAKCKSDMSEQAEKLEYQNGTASVLYSRVLAASIIGLKKQVEQYLEAMKLLGEAQAEDQLLGTVLEFYTGIQQRLNDYCAKKLTAITDIMNSVIISSQDILKGITDKNQPHRKSYLFNLSNERVINILDTAIQGADQKQLLIDYYSILNDSIQSDDEKSIASALLTVTIKNYDSILSMDFKQWAERLRCEIDYTEVFGEMQCTFPTIKEAFHFYRTCATRSTTVPELSEIHEKFKGMNYIWTFSTMKQAQGWCLVKNGLLLQQHPDFGKWERVYKLFSADVNNSAGLSLAFV